MRREHVFVHKNLKPKLYLVNLQKFFSLFKGYGLTFDDVLLEPNYSNVLPRLVKTRTWLTQHIEINVPLVSAAMDTVTESALAIALAREGGFGIVHKNLSIERQAQEIQKIKRYQSNIVTKPFTLKPDHKVSDALLLKEQHKFSTFPIIDDTGKFIGLVTNSDLKRYEDSKNISLSKVMRPLNELKVAYATDKLESNQIKQLLRKYRVPKLPILKSRREPILVGILFEKDLDNHKNFPLASLDSKGRLMGGAAVGVTADIIERIGALVDAGVDAVVIDTAHAHSYGVIQAIKKARKNFKYLEIIGGNVATAAGTKALIDAGVNAAKVGVGPGSICSTRIVAGVGVPQLTAIYESARIAKKYGIPIIGDGGIRYSGDIVKAIGAGCDTIMSGGLFAGTEESPGETIIEAGIKYKTYRGMGSIEAMLEGSKDRYFQDMEDDVKKLVPEGVVGRKVIQGTVAEIVYQLVGGLRSGMGYCGAKDIAALQAKAQFVRITSAGMVESHPHDLQGMQKAPNYGNK